MSVDTVFGKIKKLCQRAKKIAVFKPCRTRRLCFGHSGARRPIFGILNFPFLAPIADFIAPAKAGENRLTINTNLRIFANRIGAGASAGKTKKSPQSL